MSYINMSHLSVLVVEDSPFMKSLIVSVLRALGVERVIAVNNGLEAIEILKPPVQQTESMIGRVGIDLIISDFVMPDFDGCMLLRWVRSAPESPDRFLPFILMSAMGDQDVICDARDAGVNEFLAKPFSINMLSARILSIVERVRPYIFCPLYFGPDRRRKSNEYAHEDKRSITHSEIEVVHAKKDVTTLRSSRKKVWMFRLPRFLKEKLSTGYQTTERSTIDPELLMVAENKVQSMESDYSDWVAKSITKMEQEHHRAIEDIEWAEGHLEVINSLAHETRSQGSMFGYPLITQFAASLYKTTRKGVKVSGESLDLIAEHIKLIKLIIQKKIKGSGGQMGKDLTQSLEEAREIFVMQEALKTEIR